jgi:hypothetical protein
MLFPISKKNGFALIRFSDHRQLWAQGGLDGQ